MDLIAPEFLARESNDPLALAFDKMALSGAMMDRMAAGAGLDPPEDWAGFLRRGNGQPTGAYVNIPFCPSVCSFCAFFKTAFNEEVEKKYTEALLTEIAREGRAAQAAGLVLSAVYIGGGTPTVLSAANLSRLLAALREHLPLAGECELTLESRLSTLTDDKLEAAVTGGANRFSIGIQSFEEEVRRKIGRRGSAEELLARLKRISQSPGPLLALDLIYGLPGQSLEIFEQDIKLALDSGARGLAVYLLKLSPWSPWGKKIKDGLEAPPPPLPDLTKYYQLAVSKLAEAGLKQTSNSHWAFDDGDVYNRQFAARRAILALGAGAAGTLNGCAFHNTFDLNKYIAAVQEGRKPLENFWPAPPHYELLDAFSRQINEGWLDFDRLPALAGDLGAGLGQLLSQWQKAGLLTLDGRKARLSSAGLFWTPNLEYALRSFIASRQGSAA